MPKIATHDGTFHADEAFAIFMLRNTLQFKDAAIIRSRVPTVLNEADVVVDVGGEYIPEKNRYDHHQRGFMETFDSNHKTKLSSAGLIYKHFGKSVIANILEWPADDVRLDVLYIKLYDDFVEGFDGVDNGISRYPSDIKPLYKDSTSISSRVARLNPWWNEKDVDIMSRFTAAMELTGKEFTERVRYLGLAWLPARTLVEDALQERLTAHASGNVLVFDQFCPWKEHLHRLEEELSIVSTAAPVYVIYPDESGKWRVQAVPITPDSFESRKPLPEPWRGLRDDALSEKTGIPGCIFVHASGFIGGNSTKENALRMAVDALTKH
ncbi:hypothetical protein HDU67_009019 [Dinochytrium kinnereticum]|nr:hypothetical protein HDU67_009019 [Dinochytrium kinnereticum]